MTETSQNRDATEPTSQAVTSVSRRLDALLAILMLTFAFFAASFTAHNSDLWRHLATGRLLARGEYVFGTDPFAYTTNDIYWANHSWLFDLALYVSYNTLGDGAVALKALAVAALGLAMLRLSAVGNAFRGVPYGIANPGTPQRAFPTEQPNCPAGPFWISVGCCLLALLAMSSRLLLQPTCASLLLLALCVLLLHTGGRALYWVPPIVALWVNLDAWFLLGPIVAALFWLSSCLCHTKTQRLPTWLPLACMVACLLSPHHVRALTLPAELSWAVWTSEFRNDPRFGQLFISPWSLAPLGAAGGFSLAAWAYFLLLALGCLSFAVNRSAWRDWRLPVWLLFALLGAWQARLVPFFAVVAGPITALNFRERLAAHTLLRSGRIGVLLAALLLLALAYPGWLQGFHRRDRPLAWAIHVDPSLRHTAETLGAWRSDGTLPQDARVFPSHPDVSHYCTWFCPGEKVFLDSRLTLFTSVVGDYRRICAALELPAGAIVQARHDWQDVLHQRDIRCLIVYDPDLQRLTPALHEVAHTPSRWRLLRVAGQAILIEASQRGLGRPTSFDPERHTFHAGENLHLPGVENEPGLLAPSEDFWRHLDPRRPPTKSSWEGHAAGVYLRLFASADQQVDRVSCLAARLVTLPASINVGPFANYVDVSVRLATEGSLWDVSRSPALPLLAVRAARRALASHPDDARAWLALARGYLSLGRETNEFHNTLLPLAAVRQTQTATALVQSLAAQPDLVAAHETLASLFAESGYLDLAFRHANAQLKFTQKLGPFPGETQASFNSRLMLLRRDLGQLESLVQDSENRYFVRTQHLAADPLARARVALQLGLAGKALDGVLLRSSPDLYGVEGLRLLLELLLTTGRAQEARDLLDRQELQSKPDALGVHELAGNSQNGSPLWRYRFPAYDWFDLCQSAAAGNHDAATRAIERLRDQLRLLGEQLTDRLARQAAVRLAAEVGTAAIPGALAIRLEARGQREQVTGLYLQNRFLLVVRAELHTLEGMLLLERGQPAAGGDCFRNALQLYSQGADTAPALPGRPLALSLLSRLRR